MTIVKASTLSSGVGVFFVGVFGVIISGIVYQFNAWWGHEMNFFEWLYFKENRDCNPTRAKLHGSFSFIYLENTMGIDRYGILRCCIGKQRTSGKCEWKYAQ